MNEAILRKIIVKIKTAKHFKNLDEDTIKKKIAEFLRTNPKVAKALVEKEAKLEKTAEFENIVKYVKQSMHRSYGAFQENIGKREKLLEKLKASKDSLELHKKILLTHRSTKERIFIYDKLYKDLFEKIGKPVSILDLGCGLNPISLPWMGLDKIKYIASELNEEDNVFLREYFDTIQNPGYKLTTLKLDLTNDISVLKSINVDVVFAWKLFDILDTKVTENIVKSVNTKYLVASFSTKTLGNRRMNAPRRAGFQKMLRRLNLEYQTLEYENEVFYIIKY